MEIYSTSYYIEMTNIRYLFLKQLIHMQIEEVVFILKYLFYWWLYYGIIRGIYPFLFFIQRKIRRIAQIAGWIWVVVLNSSNCRMDFLRLYSLVHTRVCTFAFAVWSIVELCWGATPWGIGLHETTSVCRSLYQWGSCFFILRVYINAKKNPEMNRLRFSIVNPLWLFRFFFKSVNVPSILLLVLGMPLQPSRWQVNRYGM